MKESAKWRSGRDGERTVAMCALGRGGKSADALGDHESIARQDNGDVVMPPCKGPTFEVIETQFAL